MLIDEFTDIGFRLKTANGIPCSVENMIHSPYTIEDVRDCLDGIVFDADNLIETLNACHESGMLFLRDFRCNELTEDTCMLEGRDGFGNTELLTLEIISSTTPDAWFGDDFDLQYIGSTGVPHSLFNIVMSNQYAIDSLYEDIANSESWDACAVAIKLEELHRHGCIYGGRWIPRRTTDTRITVEHNDNMGNTLFLYVCRDSK